MIIYSKTETAGTTLGICWIQVEWAFATHIAFCTFHVLLFENMKHESSKDSLIAVSDLYRLNTNARMLEYAC